MIRIHSYRLAKLLILIFALSMTSALAVTPPESTYIDCSGKLNNGGTGTTTVCVGTDGADRIIGSSAEADLITGKYGADLIYGNAFNDVIHGDYSNRPTSGSGDTLYGGDGNDLLIGEGGSDRMHGEQGSDTYIAKDGVKDYIYCAESESDRQDDLRGGYRDDVSNRDKGPSVYDVLYNCAGAYFG